MTTSKRASIFRALTLPLSILLFWQACGWIAFGLLDPGIAQSAGQQVNSMLELTVGIVMAVIAAALGSAFFFLRTTTSQAEVTQKEHTRHKCLNCGYAITKGVAVCPRCGSKTFF